MRPETCDPRNRPGSGFRRSAPIADSRSGSGRNLEHDGVEDWAGGLVGPDRILLPSPWRDSHVPGYAAPFFAEPRRISQRTFHPDCRSITTGWVASRNIRLSWKLSLPRISVLYPLSPRRSQD